MKAAPLPAYHWQTVITWMRINARHDRRWHDPAVNDDAGALSQHLFGD